MLDILVWLFGAPSSLTALKADSVRPHQNYSGDDVAEIALRWNERSIIGNMHLSRVAHADTESVVITGTSGTAILDDKKVQLLDPSGNTVLSIDDTSSKQMVMRSMIRGFGDFVTGVSPTYASSLRDHRDTVLVSDAALRSFETAQSEFIDVPQMEEEHFTWPIITPEIEKAIIDQTHSSLSIYNRSNIYETFEDRWCNIHDLKHSLVCSSGTIAILVSLYPFFLKIHR